MNKPIIDVTRLQQGLLTLFFVVFVALPEAACSATVAMVTDLQGKAIIAGDGHPRAVSILAELENGVQVRIEAGATLVALYVDTGDEYVSKGPALIAFKPGRPEALNGAQPEKRSPAPGIGGKNIRIQPIGLAHGALVLRGARIRLLNLNDTITLETQPEFRWQELQPSLKYKIEISDDTGYSLYDAQVDTTAFNLPASVQLKEGASYTWEVSTRLPDARKFSNTGVFSVATSEMRGHAAALRPAPSVPLSSRIIYAAWLEQMNLRDEARTYWQAAALERPDDPRLKALAAQ